MTYAESSPFYAFLSHQTYCGPCRVIDYTEATINFTALECRCRSRGQELACCQPLHSLLINLTQLTNDTESRAVSLRQLSFVFGGRRSLAGEYLTSYRVACSGSVS